MQVQSERDELYDRFVKAIHEVQQKSGLKNILLEKKLSTLADALEKKVRTYVRTYVQYAQTAVCLFGKETVCFTAHTNVIRMYVAHVGAGLWMSQLP